MFCKYHVFIPPILLSQFICRVIGNLTHANDLVEFILYIGTLLCRIFIYFFT